MLFTSITFLYVFFPIICNAYFIYPNKINNLILLIASLLFYGFGEPKYLVVMIFSILLGYLFGLILEKHQGQIINKLYLFISLCIYMCIFIYFKYTIFLISNINSLFNLKIVVPNVVLPIGISFYMFQIISYNIDIYRGNISAQKNIITLGTYISMFPQLIAGPIVRYSSINDQLKKRDKSIDNFAIGIQRFIIGLSKKVLLANELGELCNIVKLSSQESVLFYWLYAISFTLHIYFDFSGYSDMAIGLGKVFGFDLNENFNYPYVSKSITEFWRRWHISLGSWFRDYIYIPLGGNRSGKVKVLLNITIVWLLTGLWHGAAWNFVVWGLMYAVLLIIEKYFLKHLSKKNTIFNHIYVIFFVVIGFVIFDAESMSSGIQYLKGMFLINDIPLITGEFIYYLKSYLTVISIGILASTPLPKKIWLKLKETNLDIHNIFNLFEIILLTCLLIISTSYIIDGSFNPFLYFRF